MKNFLSKHRRTRIVLNDAICIIIGYLVATALVFDKEMLKQIAFGKLLAFGGIMLAVYLVTFALFRINDILWSHADLKSFMKLGLVCVIASAGTYIVELVVNTFLQTDITVTFRMNLMSFITVADILLFNRILLKLISDARHVKVKNIRVPRLLMIGAGSAAELCLKEIALRKTYDVVGLIDDDVSKQGFVLGGAKVLGDRNDIDRVCRENKVEEILVAIPGAEQNELAKVVEKCEATGIKTKIIPKEGILTKASSGKIISRARDIQIEDMLYRDPIELENDKIGGYIAGRKIMVTGGGGSIGSEICRQVIKYNPARLIILDNYENNAYELMLELKGKYPEVDIAVMIATVRDKIAIDGVFAKVRPDIVFHAAAHKHVPLMEDSPKEAVKNNVFGTFNVAQASIKYGVKRFIMISTDKAVNPTNIMGATKRVCEMMIQTFNDKQRTEFVAVRFGNVLGSNGSVIPIFKQQIKDGGPVKVTHKDITRFFMTIPEAASLVLQAGVYAENGEVFVLDMGKPIKIYELAEKMIKLMGYTPGKDMKIDIVGLRPGEKLYEELYMSSENMISTKHKRIYIANPVEIDRQELYNKILDMTERIDDMTDDEVKQQVAEITGTYTFK